MTTAPVDCVDVMVVSACPKDAMGAEALLIRQGIRVVCAASAREALAALRRCEPSVVLMTAAVAHGGGSLAERKRRSLEGAEVAAIVLDTGVCEALAPTRSMEWRMTGANAGLEPSKLLEQVQALVEHHRTRRALDMRIRELALAREGLVAAMTHDLRSPLAAILLCSDRLAFDLRRNPGLQTTVRQLSASARRLADVINALAVQGSAYSTDVLGEGAGVGQRHVSDPTSAQMR